MEEAAARHFIPFSTVSKLMFPPQGEQYPPRRRRSFIRTLRVAIAPARTGIVRFQLELQPATFISPQLTKDDPGVSYAKRELAIIFWSYDVDRGRRDGTSDHVIDARNAVKAHRGAIRQDIYRRANDLGDSNAGDNSEPPRVTGASVMPRPRHPRRRRG